MFNVSSLMFGIVGLNKNVLKKIKNNEYGSNNLKLETLNLKQTKS
jgi:hypothetical protein